MSGAVGPLPAFAPFVWRGGAPQGARGGAGCAEPGGRLGGEGRGVTTHSCFSVGVGKAGQLEESPVCSVGVEVWRAVLAPNPLAVSVPGARACPAAPRQKQRYGYFLFLFIYLFIFLEAFWYTLRF